MSRIRTNPRTLASSLILTAGLLGAAFGARSQPVARAAEQRPRPQPLRMPLPAPQQLPYVPGELVVRLAPGVDGRQAAAALGLRLKKKLRYAPNTYVLTGVAGDPRQAAAALRGVPGVLQATANQRVYALAVPSVAPNDDLTGRQWALRVQNAPGFWGVSVGERLVNGPIEDDVVIGVIDSGFRIDHPDLAENLARDSAGEPGYDTVLDAPYDPSQVNFASFPANHGTWTSGCMASVTNNGEGVASLSWEGVRFLPVRALDDSGSGTIADLTEAIYYCIDEGVDVINMSLGVPAIANFRDPVAEQAIRDAYNQGIVLVASSGNFRGIVQPGVSAGVAWPAILPEVIAVGAVGPRGEIAEYSDGGPELDLVAPGGNMGPTGNLADGIVTTDSSPVPTSGSAGLPQGYISVEGTSFAAPYVSAIVATLLTQGARDSNLSPPEQVERIRQILIKTARNPFGRFTTDYGYGIVDAAAALREVTPVIDIAAPAPMEVTASFAEPLEARVSRFELQPVPGGAPGDYLKVPVPLLDPFEIEVLQNDLPVTDLVEIVDETAGQFEYQPDPVTRYGIGLNRIDIQVDNGTDPATLRSLQGPAEGRIPARSYQIRVVPRVELAGLKMLAIPYQLRDQDPIPANTVPFLFGGNLVRLARWLPQENRYALWDISGAPQEPEADLTTEDARVARPPIGVGFWARVTSPTQVQLLGRSERAPVYRIPLRPGWNLIGNPYPLRIPLNVLSVQFGNEVLPLDEAARRNLLRPSVWRFVDGRYTLETLPGGTLVEWEGHWIRSFYELTLIVPRVGSTLGTASASAAAEPAVPGGWIRSIRAVADGRLAGEVLVGEAPRARDGYGPEDAEMPPSPEVAAELRIRNADWGRESGFYLRDIRRQRAAVQRWTLEVATSRPGSAVQLTWDGFPAGARATLEVPGTGRRADLSRPGSLSLPPGKGVRRLVVTTFAPRGA